VAPGIHASSLTAPGARRLRPELRHEPVRRAPWHNAALSLCPSLGPLTVFGAGVGVCAIAMNALIPSAWAQGATSSSSQLAPLLMMVVFIAIFYFLLIRPQQKKTKDHQAMISKLSVGDEVVTSGGILGRVTDVGDTFITIEIADGVRIKVQKGQVSSLMPKGTLKHA
jgi:preprotein translocase subunit YajC